MPAVGSSRNTSVGSCTNAAASARRRCMPPDTSRTFLSRCSSSSTHSRTLVQPVPAAQPQPVHRGVEAEVLPQREVGEQRRDLRQVADLLALRRRQARRRRAPHRRRPGRRLEQPDEQAHGRRLAAPARPDQPDDAARRRSAAADSLTTAIAIERLAQALHRTRSARPLTPRRRTSPALALPPYPDPRPRKPAQRPGSKRTCSRSAGTSPFRNRGGAPTALETSARASRRRPWPPRGGPRSAPCGCGAPPPCRGTRRARRARPG